MAQSGTHRGKVAVVTGAASGIGQAYAQRLAQDGADIVVADRVAADETSALVEGAGSGVLAVKCDITDPSEVAALSKQAEDRFGRCDILVNNAGIYPVQPFEAITFDDWRRVMAVNLDAQFLTVQAFAPGMRRRGWGRIVNMASNTFGLVIEGFSHYVASKGGVIGFTRALASEFGRDGVTVNAIAPSLVRTPGTVGREDTSGSEGGEFAALARMQSIKRSQMPADLVGTLSFLVSDDAAFITGQTIFVDGGLVRG